MQNKGASLELLRAAASEKLYALLVQQLEKDFKMANVALKPLGQIAPDALIAQLRERIYRLILEDFTDYLNLLYVVDVPEKAFKHLTITDAVEVAEQVSFLILERELLKVRLKRKYSN